MTPERWQMVRGILQNAMELRPDERNAFLDRECAADPSLRNDVDKYLSIEGKLDPEFLESPAANQVGAPSTTAAGNTLLAAGTRLGPYQVQALLGAGGMGEVYRARDTRLNRTVAIKVIPQSLSTDPARLQRFEREARAIAALQHPNICTLHDIGHQDGMQYLVMEHLDGETLAKRLQKGRLSLEQTLRYGAEIGDALDAADRRGIVHRDLKPANIFLTTHGEAKVLDFGLAKLDEPEPELDTSAETAMNEKLLTTPGVAMGTAPYMSPEQARGEVLDARTDVFSLGAVLYEMATGKMAFPGKTTAIVHKAILTDTPPQPSQLVPSLPEEMDRIIGKALEKDRDLRYQSAADVRADLTRLRLGWQSGKTAAAVPRWRAKWAVATSVTLLCVGLIFWLYPSRQSHALTDKDLLVLADFVNATGDALFEGTLRQGLAVQLGQSPFLNLVSDEQIQHALSLMGQKPDARLTSDIARQLCQRIAATAVVEGSIASLGTEFVIGLRTVSCRTGRALAEQQVQAVRKEDVLKALSEASAQLRKKLGESLSTVEKFDTPLDQATTPSLDALLAYTMGRKKIISYGDYTTAIPFFQRAIDLDPNFAMAHLSLGLCYDSPGQLGLAAASIQRAFELREHVSEWEKFAIESRYYFSVKGNLPEAQQVYRLWAQIYPHEHIPLSVLGWEIDPELGRYDDALADSLEALSRSPQNAEKYVGLVVAYMYLGQFNRARATADEASRKKLESMDLPPNLYHLAFLEKDSARMAQEVAWAAGKPGVEDVLLSYEADTAAFRGQIEKARELSRRAMASAQQAGEKETVAFYQAESAVREGLFGNFVEARNQAEAALALSSARDVEAQGAFALALGGGPAERLAQDLARRFPEDTMVQFIFLPVIRAQLALNHRDPARAVKELDPGAAFELGNASPGQVSLFALYPCYLRGNAFLASNKGKEAAAEFQKILDHPGVVINEPIGALAHKGLADAYRLMGQLDKAKASYGDFMTLWHEADTRNPILLEASLEHKQLDRAK